MSPFPQSLMDNVLWSFSGDPATDPDAFSAQLSRYSLDIVEEDRWRPDEVVLRAPTVRVTYEYWDLSGPEEREATATLELKASNGKHFTALDLLYQVHNAVVKNLRNLDHKFFEGFSGDNVGDNVPSYWLNLGS